MTRAAISSVLFDPSAPLSLVPTMPTLSASPYMPAALASLSTSFTSAGTMPRAASTSNKPVAQRRSQAPVVTVRETRKVGPTEFEQYLSELGGEADRWERERQLGRRGVADLGALQQERRGSLTTTLAQQHSRDDSYNQGERGYNGHYEEELPPLDQVPQIFFDPSFNLANPRTFDLVTEKILSTPSSSPIISRTEWIPRPRLATHTSLAPPRPGLGPLTLAELATDQLLQDKLSHYTAIVESHLVQEIGVRSSSFFSALANLQSLQQQGESTLESIEKLQALLSPSQGVGGAAQRGLAILTGQARRRGLETLDDGLHKVTEIYKALDVIQDLIENAEWMTALQVREQVEAAYWSTGVVSEPAASKSTAPSIRSKHQLLEVSLSQIKALDFLPAKLDALRAYIASSLQVELVGVLDRSFKVSMDERAAQAGGATLVLGSAASTNIEAVIPSSTPVDISWPLVEHIHTCFRARERVRPIVQSLIRADGIEGAVAAWKLAVLAGIKHSICEVCESSARCSLRTSRLT